MSVLRDELLTESQVAEHLGILSGTLKVWRCTGRYALPYVKVGRCIRYRRSDLDDFLKRRTMTHTSGPMAD